MNAIQPLSAVDWSLGHVAEFDLESPTEVGDAAREAFANDGVVCLRNAFSEHWLDTIETGIAQVLARPSINSYNIKADPSDDGFFFYDTLMWQHTDPLKAFIFDSNAPDLYRSLLATDKLFFYYDFLIIKNAGCEQSATPWHHDIAYYPLDGTQIANCWTALDRIPFETALRFVRGSNNFDTIYRATHFDPEDDYDKLITSRPEVLDFDQMAADGECEIVSCEMNPGDSLVCNCRTLHCAPGNHLGTRRAAFSTNWAGDDVVYRDIPQETDPSYRGEGLVDGGSIECKSFPRVR